MPPTNPLRWQPAKSPVETHRICAHSNRFCPLLADYLSVWGTVAAMRDKWRMRGESWVPYSIHNEHTIRPLINAFPIKSSFPPQRYELVGGSWSVGVRRGFMDRFWFIDTHLWMGCWGCWSKGRNGNRRNDIQCLFIGSINICCIESATLWRKQYENG